MHCTRFNRLVHFIAPPALLLATIGSPPPAAAAMPVFDVTNYAQNILQASRTLTQINNQIRSLQNEAAMLTNMAKNLSHIDFPQLRRITQTLDQINGLMGQARGIGFRVDGLEQQFRQLFPQGSSSATIDGRLGEARTRLEAATAAFEQSMRVQSQVVTDVAEDARTLDEMATASQNAEGVLQVGQATNQLLALAAKQQSQLQNMIAAQYRADAFEQARSAQAETDARATTIRFLGSGSAYSPR